MKTRILFSVIVLIVCTISAKVASQTTKASTAETYSDSLRIVELDRFWKEVSRTVREGDYEGYKATCHDEAVCIFATREKKVSIPMTAALEGWKQGFADTRSGKLQDNVEFRFSQRIGDATTAHETGIFAFTSVDSKSKIVTRSYIHFEELLVKRNGTWKVLMEYQKGKATQEEWELLK
jgi:hypothetical protein